MSSEWVLAFMERRLATPLTEQLLQELQAFGISHFYYTRFFAGAMHAGIASRKRSNDFSFEAISSRTMERMHYIAPSDSRFLRMLARYFHSYGDKDEWMNRSPSCGIEVVFDEQEFRGSAKVVAACDAFDVHSSAFYDTSRKNNTLGSFALHSKMSPQGFSDSLSTHQPQLIELLEHYNNRFANAYEITLNPWINLGIISPVAQRILQMLAQGETTESVAKALYISKRGVDYHLEQMKLLMEAKTRGHLIAKACAHGLLDLSAVNGER